MATREKSKTGRLGSLQRLLARLNANHEELPHLEVSRARLEALLHQAQEAAGRQAGKLADFGLKPFRGRPRNPTSAPAPQSQPSPQRPTPPAATATGPS